MKVFATNHYFQDFANLLAHEEGFEVGQAHIERYNNKEVHARVFDDLSMQDCVIIGSTAPPDANLISLIVLADALVQSGARNIFAFLPYLGYARHDKPRQNESATTALIGTLLKNAGISSVFSIDVHSKLDAQIFGLPLISLSPAPLFAEKIKELGWNDASFLAPDEGAIQRTLDCKNLVGNTSALTHLVKRHENGIKHFDIVGSIEKPKKVVIVDDIIDTSKTLISACSLLKERGQLSHGIIFVTHCILSTRDWEHLPNIGISSIFTTNTCPEATNITSSILNVIGINPIIPVLADILRKEPV